MTNAKKAQSTEPKKAPVHKIFISGVRASVWENVTKEGEIRHNVTLEKSYKTENGYGQTGSFGVRDLQNVRKALDDAHTWILNQSQHTAAAEAPEAEEEIPY